MAEFHTLEIDPPNKRRIHYVVTCSYGDLNRSYRTRHDAMTASLMHISQVVERAEVDDGIDFDSEELFDRQDKI